MMSSFGGGGDGASGYDYSARVGGVSESRSVRVDSGMGSLRGGDRSRLLCLRYPGIR